MINKNEILKFASITHLRPDIIEKDYVLGWLLAGIYNHSEINKKWIFKGGTCLKKCYFETYRFSEDLDFTLTEEAQINEAFLKSTFENIGAWIYEQTGIVIPSQGISFDIHKNPRGTISCQGKIPYLGPISTKAGGYPKIKLDLTADERLVLAPEEKSVYHPYSDNPMEGIKALCYVYEEVFGEKFRALAERTRPRDLYDVVNLFRNTTIKPTSTVILHILAQKCEFKGIPIPVLSDLERHRETLEASWISMLNHQLPELPPLESYWNELPAIFDWLENGKEPTIPTAYPLMPGETIIRERYGEGLMIWQGAQYIEIIRFAAFNRLCVELDYRDELGNRNKRIIEPYSLRKTNENNIILHSFRGDIGQHRGYRTDRILGARVTNKVFRPRYEIELTSTGPVILLQTIAQARETSKAANTFKRVPRKQINQTTFNPLYVFQCPFCQRKFTLDKNDPKLRKHKNARKSDCPGRIGNLVRVT